MALNWDDFRNSWSFWSCNWDVEKPHFNGSSKSESKGFSEAVNDDIVDRLPADPFGMEISSTLTSAITGWIQDFENDLGSDLCMFGMQDGDEKKIADQQHLFKGLNWVWNGNMNFQQEEGNSSFYGFGSNDIDKKIGDKSSFFKGVNWVWNGTMSFQQEEGNFEINEISTPNDDSADPFGMEISSTLTSAITGWIQDFENDLGSDLCMFGMQDGDEKKIADQQHLFKGLNWVWNGNMNFQQEEGNSSFYGFGSNDIDKKIGDKSSFFKGVNWVWNGTMSFQQEEGNFEINEISTPNDDFNGFGIGNGLSNGGFVFNDEGKGLEDCKEVFCDGSAAPNDALLFTLVYLGVKDLLAVERVCRSLRDTVRSDPLLWRSINIEHSLSKRITDDSLLKLTSRVQGTLQCLSLVGCIKITDDGLKRVLDSNPKLTKLSVPECTRLSVEGILSNLRAFRSYGSPGIKHLRIGGCFGVTEEQFKELKFLLGVDNSMQLREQKPQYFRLGQLHLICNDDRAIDIEVCPRCQKLKLVYDCPSESCRRTHHAAQLCRACILCKARCIHCGCCFKDCDYEETFTLDLLCFNCRKQKFNCEEKPEVIGASSSKHTIFHQETGYQFCFYG